MRHAGILWLAAACVWAAPLHASTYTYKFVGKPFTTVTGCLTTKDHISMKMVFAQPIAPGQCSSSPPTHLTISDGVNTQKGAISHFDGSIILCKTANKITSWTVIGDLFSKPGSPLILVELQSGPPALDEVYDYVGACAPVSQGSSALPGKWSGP